MRIFLFILSLISCQCFCQVSSRPVARTEVPGNLTYKGRLKQAFRFTDTSGDYLLILTETGVQAKKGSDGSRSAHLYAGAYRWQDKTQPQPVWQLNDGVDNCPLDIMAEFIAGTTRVTDLDKDGTAEVWTMYRTACRGDVSGADTKIIMHEGSVKYAMRGEGSISIGGNLQPGGNAHAFDDAFTKAPAVFRQYAETLWKQNATEVLK